MADILSKVRGALVNYVTGADVGAEVYDGKRSGDKAAPNVSCGADNAHEEPVGSGNFWVEAVVETKTLGMVGADGIDPKPASDAIETAVIAALEVTDLAEQLSAAGAFTVFGFGEEKDITRSVEGDCWILSWKRKIYCCVTQF